MSSRLLVVLLGAVSVFACATTDSSAQEVPANQVERSDQVEIIGTEVRLPPMSRAFIDRFFDSLRSKTGFVPASLVESKVVDANTSGIWAGTRTEVEMATPRVILRFRPTAEARLERAARSSSEMLAEEFDVSLAWEPRGLRLRHPLAKDPRVKGGVLAEVPAFEREAARTEYFSAGREAGLYVSVPAMLRSETDKAWSVLICPRVVSAITASSKVKAGYELLPSPYELAEVYVEWHAHATASIPFGSHRERIRIDLALTSDLPASRESHDEVTSVSPMLSLGYQPTVGFTFQRYPQDGEFRQGVVFRVEMRNPAGHRRVQHFSQVVYAQRLDEPSPVAVIVKDQIARRDEGACYAVAAQRSVWSRYDKVEPVE